MEKHGLNRIYLLLIEYIYIYIYILNNYLDRFDYDDVFSIGTGLERA